MVWEGGIRNRALVCAPTLLPVRRLGAVYQQGLVHVLDWHATFLDLAGLGDTPTAADPPLDGVSVWSALVADSPSPRTEFLVNIDPSDQVAPGNRTW